MLAPAPPPAPSASLSRAVLHLALPALFQQYLHLLVRLSDQFLADRFPLSDPAGRPYYLAALTTAGYIYWFISSYTVLVSVGATALVARAIGARDHRLAWQVTAQAVLLAGVFGSVGTVAGLAGLPHLLHLLQLEAAAVRFALEFLTPLALLLPFQMMETACTACLAGAGDTRTGLHVLGGVALLNLPLAWLLCFGIPPLVPGLGFAGIAWGTGLAHTLGCFILLRLLRQGRSGLRLQGQDLWPNGSLIRRLLRVSVPAAVDSLSMAVCQFWFLSVVNRLGATAAAAHGIALQWEALAYLAGGAFGTAAMALVGQNLGARQPQRASRAAWIAWGQGAAVMCGMGLVFVLAAKPMFRLFCHEADTQAVVQAGVPVLQLISLAMPALAAQIIFTAALRGAGDVRVPVLITWFGFLGIRLPLAHFLAWPEIPLGADLRLPALGLGLRGAWIAMVLDLWVRGLLLTWRFVAGRWRHIEV
ncbi:MATE family efflux transporter [Thermogemmata fonticola]|uniref:Multidrug-efflux transporter n=1 Tax=Thermogemmata fonticola TaxID=2755323 RepID=A0A7V8VDF1_9BACT|nr:MATE family efflux transporter [Thermogemmata fonticola]MBA2226009.1 MATE family efflux transporter [Thermogemmata fonticola]